MFHLIAYYESIDPAAAATAIAAVQDPTINTTGDDVRMSAALPSIAGCTALTAAAVFTSGQLRAPSLRTLNNLDIRPLVNAVTFGDPPQPMMFPRNVRPVVPAEDLQAFVTSTPAGGAEAHYALVWLADAALPQVNGAMFTVGASSASTLTAGNWVNSNITFDQTLPSGSYQVVGMRAEGANLVAARLVFLVVILLLISIRNTSGLAVWVFMAHSTRTTHQRLMVWALPTRRKLSPLT